MMHPFGALGEYTNTEVRILLIYDFFAHNASKCLKMPNMYKTDRLFLLLGNGAE